jgi:molybdopterin converting factor small subunit
MRVVIPSPLFSYTGGQQEVEGAGDTLARLLNHLDERFPGIRHRMIDEQDRIRPHIRVFVNQQMVSALDSALQAGDDVLIVAALSGG